MKSIQDFNKDMKSNTVDGMKAYSKLGIDQVLNQLMLLLKEDSDNLQGVFYLRNRSPLMTQSPLAYITNFIGDEEYKNQLLGKEIFYSSFPRLRNISKNHDLAQIDVLANSAQPLSFEKDKSFIASAVRDEGHNWGMLVCFTDLGQTWSVNQLKLIESFSTLLCSTIHFFHEQEKDLFLMQNSRSKETSQARVIQRLEERLEKKNKLIEQLKEKGNDDSNISAAFNWSDKEETDFDEVWVTVHGYKNGSEEPVVSKWEKINDKSLLATISDLFFNSKSNKKAV